MQARADPGEQNVVAARGVASLQLLVHRVLRIALDGTVVRDGPRLLDIRVGLSDRRRQGV